MSVFLFYFVIYFFPSHQRRGVWMFVQPSLPPYQDIFLPSVFPLRQRWIFRYIRQMFCCRAVILDKLMNALPLWKIFPFQLLAVNSAAQCAPPWTVTVWETTDFPRLGDLHGITLPQ